MSPFRVAVLYGSQTGNAQSIAEGVHDGCKERAIESTLLTCDRWKKMTPELKEWSAVVLVVSTTGNGDPPENMERFWRFHKRRTQPKDLLAGLPFCLLGLGDTNYDKFCHMGKSLDKRLRELGAEPFYPAAFADEATNMEETVDPWVEKLFPALESLRQAGEGPVEEQEERAGVKDEDGATRSQTAPSCGAEVRHEPVTSEEPSLEARGEKGDAVSPGVDDDRHSKATEPQTTAVEDAPNQPCLSMGEDSDSATVAEASETQGEGVSSHSLGSSERTEDYSDVRTAAVEAVAASGADSVAVNVRGDGVSDMDAASLNITEGMANGKKGVGDGTEGIREPSVTPDGDLEKGVERGRNVGETKPEKLLVEQGLESAVNKLEALSVGGKGIEGVRTVIGGTASDGKLPDHRIAVMYGSQTGNAQAIAERVHEGCREWGLETTLSACDGWKKINPDLKALSALVLVVSTTGNGDAPENMERFWRFLKRRTQPKDLLQGVPFSVLGLGDTNYDKFCYMGKNIDKRFRELGAVPFHPPAFADEATRMEETVEPWVNSVYPALVRLVSSADGTVRSDADGEQNSHASVVASPESTADSRSAAADSMVVVSVDAGSSAMSEMEKNIGDEGVVSAASATIPPPVESSGDALSAASLNNAAPGIVAADTRLETPVQQPPADLVETRVILSMGKTPSGIEKVQGVVARDTDPQNNVATTAVALKDSTSVTKSAGLSGEQEVCGSGADSMTAAAPKSRSENSLGQWNGTDSALASKAASEGNIVGKAAVGVRGETSNGAGSVDEVAEISAAAAAAVFWSPSAESGVRPLMDFLEPEHLAPDFSLAKEDLPRSRPPAPDVEFPDLGRVDGSGEAAHDSGDKDGRAWYKLGRVHRSSSMESGHTCEWPFMAHVTGARYLTKGGRQEDRRVILMELSLKGSGISYEPGDVIGVRCPNPPRATEFLLRRLEDGLPPRAGVDEPFQHSIRGLPSPYTLREALSTGLDLQAPLRRPLLRALSEWCKDEREKAWMELLCSKTKAGGEVYSRFVCAQSLTLCELLEAFPSCTPVSVGALLALLPPLPPRYYSVASSPLTNPHSLSVAFSVVSYRLHGNGVEGHPSSEASLEGKPGLDGNIDGVDDVPGMNGNNSAGVVRHGLCTTWLEVLLQPMLERGRDGTVVMEGKEILVPVFMKPTKEFLLPASAKWPCVLIGPGTGVSPFIGFLKHREEQMARRQQTMDAVCSGFWRGGYEIALEGEEDEAQAYSGKEGRGDMWLFFGCRRRDQDWIFQEEMEAFLKKGTLARLMTAFSRESTNKVYVQDRILESGSELSRLMLEGGAYIYVCGDGNAMAQGVHRTLVQVLVEHGGMTSEADAEACLKTMKARNRYVLDVWS